MESPPATRELDPSASLSIAEAVQLGADLHAGGHHADAFKVYKRVLDLAPEHPDALHFMGILAHEQGQDEAALRLLAHSLELVPDHAGFRNNFGNLLLDMERFEEAELQYRRALALDPDRPDALHNYAVLCKALHRYEDAERCLLRVLELSPDFTAARNSLAGLYLKLGRIDESVTQACEALIREPRNPNTRELLGFAQYRAGHPQEAAQVYREWLAEEPDNPKARHYLAACTGEDVPARASDAYVQSFFDSFSETFDARLALLEYRAPSLVGEAVGACLGAPAAGLAVLDAGCGTGLCASLLKPFAATLTGVDLSRGMLDKARARRLYDDLCQAELCDYLRRHPEGYDLIVSADTLVYFGALEEAIGAAAGALRAGGTLCFTVEALAAGESGDYRLLHHGRYAHSSDYLTRLLGQAGLVLARLEQVILRHDAGLPVVGWLVLAQRPGGQAAAGAPP